MECQVRGIPIYYKEIGTGATVIMLHGWAADHRHMVRALEPIFQGRTGWRRLYLDLPGMGRTPVDDRITTQDQMLDIILEFIDTVAPNERLVVVGSSYGGYLARGIVHHRGRSLNGILLIVPSVDPCKTRNDLPPREVLVQDADVLRALEPSEAWIRDVLVVQSMTALQEIREVLEPALATADKTFLARLDAAPAFTFDVDALPEPFCAPALIITGRQDSVIGFRQAYRLLDDFPRASFAVLDRAGHMLTREQPSLFRALASEWLDRVEEFAS